MSGMADFLNKLKETIQELAEGDRPRNKQDLFVLVLHIVMLVDGFRCVGLSEHDDPREPGEQQQIPPGWNANRDSYCFKYRHSRSSMTFVLKLITLGDSLLIVHAMSVEDKKPVGMDLNIAEYIRGPTAAETAETAETPFPTTTTTTELDSYFRDLDKLFTLVRLQISRKLVPYSDKEGYEENAPSTTTGGGGTVPRPPRQPTPSTPQPVQPPPPERPYPDVDPLRAGPIRTPPIFPYRTGDEDLYPGGAPLFYTPHRGHGPPTFPGPRGGGGMHIGPTHPGFGPGVRDPYATGPPGGGIPGGIPPGSVPPGARFDPFGPPRVGRGGMPGPAGGGNPRRGPNQGFPDPDELPPPGSDDDAPNPYWL